LLGAEDFDAVLMDCQMPVMDGSTATLALRRRETAGGRVPVIALTADATSEGRAACLAAGMDDFLPKPFTREALHAVLARCLTQRPGAPAAAAALAEDAEETLLDAATIAVLRGLPCRGARHMFERVAQSYLAESDQHVATIKRAIDAGECGELARAAHAWRSYNGNAGAFGLVRLCRDLEEQARRGDLSAAAALLVPLSSLHDRVRAELKMQLHGELRRSA
jgi:CheY-like chemotaxis protein